MRKLIEHKAVARPVSFFNPKENMNTQTLSSYRDRPHWSYSSLNQLLNLCSLQWFFEKVERIPKPFTPVAIAFGGVYHRVMEFIALSRMEQKLPTESDTRDLFHDLWKREGEDGPPLEKDEEITPDEVAAQGAELVVAYLKQIEPEERVVNMNEVFAVPVGDSERPIIGEIDCVVERAGGRVIVDWKTSAKRWPKTQADRSLQPTIYLYAHRDDATARLRLQQGIRQLGDNALNLAKQDSAEIVSSFGQLGVRKFNWLPETPHT